jgi:predicted membrane channel-forming protein YqfA (hemolysin III family)
MPLAVDLQDTAFAHEDIHFWLHAARCSRIWYAIATRTLHAHPILAVLDNCLLVRMVAAIATPVATYRLAICASAGLTHASVLTECSGYFANAVSNIMPHGLIRIFTKFLVVAD